MEYHSNPYVRVTLKICLRSMDNHSIFHTLCQNIWVILSRNSNSNPYVGVSVYVRVTLTVGVEFVDYRSIPGVTRQGNSESTCTVYGLPLNPLLYCQSVCICQSNSDSRCAVHGLLTEHSCMPEKFWQYMYFLKIYYHSYMTIYYFLCQSIYTWAEEDNIYWYG